MAHSKWGISDDKRKANFYLDYESRLEATGGGGGPLAAAERGDGPRAGDAAGRR